MGFTAFTDMQKRNYEKYGVNFPKQPDFIHVTANQGDMEQSALFFIRDRCEGLLFDQTVADREKETGQLEGTSLTKGQIPYNMEKDIDRICLEHAVHMFMKTGTAEDAFDVYYCYMEMFMGDYHTSKRMIELLSEYESNASSLLSKHRDHYSHSVYVFILGLAIYEANAYYRQTYKIFYGIEDEHKAAHHFLEFWGLTSLFHDIGYPFELPFEQVKSYFADTEKTAGNKRLPFIAYNNTADFISFTDGEKNAVVGLGNGSCQAAENICGLLAQNIANRMGCEYGVTVEPLTASLADKPAYPDKFGGYMDHAFFSSTILFRKLVEGLSKLKPEHIDALSAIVLHNSLFKFTVTGNYKDNFHPLKAELHPLAYMLMLCDELQCWNRTSYGKNSRRETHPMWCHFTFRDNEIFALYAFDTEEQNKIDFYEQEYRQWESQGKIGKAPSLKAYSSIRTGSFLDDIQRIVFFENGKINLKVGFGTERAAINRTTYLSDSSFLSLHNFTVALFGRRKYKYDGVLVLSEENIMELEESFSRQSLEYQLSGVSRAKHFAKYLHEIGCFYTDRSIGFEMLNEFTPEHMAVIGPLEHKRWEEEKRYMGWAYGTKYQELAGDKDVGRALREQFRMNNLLGVDYNDLSEEEQDKDTKPMQVLIKLIRQFDGLRIYRL